MPVIVRLATRGSRLALWQAEYVKMRLYAIHPHLAVEIMTVSTTPDRHPETPLDKLGGDKGLFVKEVEQTLTDGRADIAVHSLKDVPSIVSDELPLAAFPQRANPADVLLGPAPDLASIPLGARIATSSLRRSGQLLALRKDLKIVPLRGNLDTRLQKLHDGQYDAMVLAAAGLERLGLQIHIQHYFSSAEMMSAPGQGALAVQCRAETIWLDMLKSIDDTAVRTAVTAERAISANLNADCHSALAAYCCPIEGGYQLNVRVCNPDGGRQVEGSILFSDNGAEAVAELSQNITRLGADEILHPKA